MKHLFIIPYFSLQLNDNFLAWGLFVSFSISMQIVLNRFSTANRFAYGTKQKTCYKLSRFFTLDIKYMKFEYIFEF